MTETEVKIRFSGTPQEARSWIEGRGFEVSVPRTLESDQLFDREGGDLRAADQLIRLRRRGTRATVTYKGPATRERYKSREEIEFDVSDADAFELVLNRLGYQRKFRYEKYRTTYQAGEGIVTLDETPIGIFLELEGPAAWIDKTADSLGVGVEQYCTLSYAALYKEYLQAHPSAAANMIFNTEGPP